MLQARLSIYKIVTPAMPYTHLNISPDEGKAESTKEGED